MQRREHRGLGSSDLSAEKMSAPKLPKAQGDNCYVWWGDFPLRVINVTAIKCLRLHHGKGDEW